MDNHSMLAPLTFALKLNICCQGCERKLKKLLQKIHRVHSISIDAELGKVTISGTVDPSIVIKELERHKKAAQLVLENSPNMNNQNKQIALQPNPVQEMYDQNMVAQLEQLSEIEGLKHVKVTYSKTVKLTFPDNKDETSDDKHGPQGCHGCATSSFCGARVMNNVPYGCHGISATCHCGIGQWPPCPKNFPEEPQPIANYDPSAPPLPRAYAYPDTFGEENPNSCNLM